MLLTWCNYRSAVSWRTLVIAAVRWHGAVAASDAWWQSRRRLTITLTALTQHGRQQALTGELVLYPGRNFDRALEDLDGFDFVWVISYMHLNQGWNPKVKPPRGPRVKRGARRAQCNRSVCCFRIGAR
jgi:tRNA-methyltransferase O